MSIVNTADSASATVVSDVPGSLGYIDPAQGWEWTACDASLTFVDIGDNGAGPRAQIALYVEPLDSDPMTGGVSIELNREEAQALVARLQTWIETSREEAFVARLDEALSQPPAMGEDRSLTEDIRRVYSPTGTPEGDAEYFRQRRLEEGDEY